MVSEIRKDEEWKCLIFKKKCLKRALKASFIDTIRIADISERCGLDALRGWTIEDQNIYILFYLLFIY